MWYLKKIKSSISHFFKILTFELNLIILYIINLYFIHTYLTFTINIVYYIYLTSIFIIFPFSCRDLDIWIVHRSVNSIQYQTKTEQATTRSSNR